MLLRSSGLPLRERKAKRLHRSTACDVQAHNGARAWLEPEGCTLPEDYVRLHLYLNSKGWIRMSELPSHTITKCASWQNFKSPALQTLFEQKPFSRGRFLFR